MLLLRECLLKILKRCNDDDKFEQQWFDDCAKIWYNITNKKELIERKRGRNNSKFNARVRELEQDLKTFAAPGLPVKL